VQLEHPFRLNTWQLFRISIIVLLLLVVALLVSRSRQKSAFNDSDLLLSRIEVPVESNAFWTLLKATNELYWPGLLQRELGNLSINSNWDESLAADVLKKNRTCMDLFDESLRQPFLLIPEPKTITEDYPYLGTWRTISQIESIRGISLFRAKSAKAALDSALKVIQFGQRIENSGGVIIHYLVGSAIKKDGLLRIQQMIADTTLKEADLFALIRELDGFKPNKEGFTNALKVEYQMERTFVDDIAVGKYDAAETTTSAPERKFATINMWVFFNPTKTKIGYAQSARVIRDNMSKPFGNIPWSDLPVLETNAPIWKRLLSGNAIGDMLYEMQDPELKRLSLRKSQEDVNVTATQLLVALKIYKIRHDKLPKSLSELVPEFFPQVPIDDFDGNPFRYSPDKKLIYSVGPDLKDLGGEGFHKNSATYNLPFKIEF
jgi:hypothetical protein